MGSLCSREEDSADGKIDRQLKEDYKAEQKNVKLLLLGEKMKVKIYGKIPIEGAANGGKSTLLRQMQILHTDNFKSTEERLIYKANVHANVLVMVERMLRAIDQLVASRWAFVETEKAVVILRDSLKLDNFVDPLESAEFIGALKALWVDPCLHDQVMPNGGQFHLLECTEHLMNSLDRITAPEFVPTLQDILMMRVPTTGISEVNFTLNKLPFKVFDVGGQRTERRKWIHCFDNVNAIIFVTSLSEFDEVLEEDGQTNRMLESMRLLRSICSTKWFIQTALILFLNKKDLFEQKIRRKSIRMVFKNYSGSDSYDDQANYVQQKFESLNGNPHKKIFSHQTCATDTDQIGLVLKNVFELILMSLYKKTSMY